MSDVKLDDIVSLCKRRGFIYQGSEVYGGLAGTWDYGPLGVVLKRNIMELWWKMFVDDMDNMYGLDAAILMNQKTWQASGHVDTFTDPLIECQVCKMRFRVDHLIKEWAEGEKAQGNDVMLPADFMPKTINEYAKEYNLKCPKCGGELGEARTFNMMFKTNAGPVDDESSLTYLRPETAQGIFTNYKNIVDSFSPDLPFGIAQQGKAFRNEISPRDFVFRSREFEQMEIEYFIRPDGWEQEFEKWINRIDQYLRALGLPEDKITKHEVPEQDLAHYSKRTIDFEFDYPHGKDELLGLAYRTDFDLQNVERVSGKNMQYRPKDGSEPFVPHVLEPSFGVERAVMAVLTSAYTEDEVGDEKRTLLKLPAHLAPVKVAVSPLLKNKPELVSKAREVYEALKKEFGNVMWDDNGNIGKRYRKQDEIGTPHCVVVDFQTLEDSTVTVRDRDTTNQERVVIDELVNKLKS
jgi:glycyl-tRNA synthetase